MFKKTADLVKEGTPYCCVGNSQINKYFFPWVSPNQPVCKKVSCFTGKITDHQIFLKRDTGYDKITHSEQVAEIAWDGSREGETS